MKPSGPPEKQPIPTSKSDHRSHGGISHVSVPKLLISTENLTLLQQVEDSCGLHHRVQVQTAPPTEHSLPAAVATLFLAQRSPSGGSVQPFRMHASHTGSWVSGKYSCCHCLTDIQITQSRTVAQRRGKLQTATFTLRTPSRPRKQEESCVKSR